MEDRFVIETVPEPSPTPVPIPVSVVSTPASRYPDDSNLDTIQVGSTEQVTLLDINLNRLGAIIHNHSNDQLYIALGSEVSSAVFTQVMQSHSYLEFPTPVYRGIVTALRPTGASSGPVMVTELIYSGNGG